MRIVFLCLVVFGLSAIALWRTDGFSPESIRSPLLAVGDPQPVPIEWPKRFHYLDKGRQAFAFESEDGKYVLKFFKSLKMAWYMDFPFLEKNKRRLQEKIRIYPESYYLAFDQMREETGLLAVHLGASEEKYPVITLIDKASGTHQVDLNQVPFILQKKGNGPFLTGLEQNRTEILDQFFAMHRKRIALCIADHDRDIRRNYCWDGKELLYIDPARFYYDLELQDPKRALAEWKKVTYPLRKWLKAHAPDEVALIDKRVNDAMDPFLD